MDYLVCYDICDPKRLRQVARVIEAYGERVQKSVFECALSDEARRQLMDELRQVMRPTEDQVRIYPLFHGARRKQKVLGNGMPAEVAPTAWIA